MWWFAFAAFVLYLAVQSRGFRHFLGYCLLLALIGLGPLKLQSLDEEQKAKVALTRIAHERLTFADMDMGLDGPDVWLRGRVQNGDPTHTLTRFQLRLRVFDCQRGAGCTSVGEERTAVGLSVPPLQQREFRQSVHFAGLGASRPGRVWDFSVASVSGE